MHFPLYCCSAYISHLSQSGWIWANFLNAVTCCRRMATRWHNPGFTASGASSADMSSLSGIEIVADFHSTSYSKSYLQHLRWTPLLRIPSAGNCTESELRPAHGPHLIPFTTAIFESSRIACSFFAILEWFSLVCRRRVLD